MKTLINLISGQAIPNLIAHKFVSPDKIILLYSKGSVKQKENFKSTCRNVQFEEYEIEPYNFEKLSNLISEIISMHSGENLILIFTCGTKIMSVASFEVFRSKDLECIYIDSENGKIYRFLKDNVVAEELNITLTLEEHLKLNGHIYELSEGEKIDDEKRNYYEYLETSFNEAISEFLSQINDNYKTDKNNFYILYNKIQI
ncbi:MAG: DUF1887 family CARF protein [Candidatus Anstonellales archaeon]